MKLRFFISILIISSLSAVTAQEQSPPEKNRKQIDGRHARIIYSPEMEPHARRASVLIDSMYAAQSTSLNSYPKKVPILLYNHTVISNGYAALYPRRSTWFITPMQEVSDLGNADWLTTLGVHEFRHIVQYEKYNKHFTKFLYYVFGETGIVMGRYSIPYWFAEGDAIAAETAYTRSGRGRLPKFEMPLKAILLSDLDFNYQKFKLDSYKNFIPNYYHLGWLMISYGRLKYGIDIWDKTLDHTSKISFWPWAFSRGLKKHTGLSERKFFNDAANYYDSLWSTQNAARQFDTPELLTPESKTWASCSEGDYLPDGSLIYIKYDLRDTKHLFRKEAGKEPEKLFALQADMISAEAGKICHSKPFFDKRYEYRSWSDIMLYDMKTGKKKRLTKKEKYFAPALSPDGKKICAVRYDEAMNCTTVIIDSETGELLSELPNSENDFIRTPVWSPNGEEIAYTSTNFEGLSLIVNNIQNQETDTLIKRTTEAIGRPAFYKHYILFHSNYDGIDNIYAFDRQTRTVSRVTSVPFGAFNPKVKGDTLLYDYYSEKGYQAAQSILKPDAWKPKSEIEQYESERVKAIQKQEGFARMKNYESIDLQKLSQKKYRPLRDAFKVYSWGFYTDYTSQVSFQLASNNLLNTFRTNAKLIYDLNEETLGSSLSFKFSKYYPVFEVYGGYFQRFQDYGDEENPLPDDWDEIRTGLNISVPLNLKYGTRFSSFQPSVDIGLRSITDKDYRYLDQFGNGTFAAVGYQLFWYNVRRQAKRDIYPRTGTVLQGGYKHLPFNDEMRAEQLYGIARQYLPGIWYNHALVLSASGEIQQNPGTMPAPDYYRFATPIRFARGHDPSFYKDMYKLTAEYHLPVWYPDIALGPIAYFKRIRAGLFYDYANVDENTGSRNTYQSAGLELYLQADFLSLQQDIEIGGRVSYLFNNEEPIYQLLLLGIPF